MLNIHKTIEEIKAQYAVDEARGYNLMVYGQAGTWKTSASITCPRPIYIQSFDRHGWSSIKDHVDGKSVIVDTRFEGAFGSRMHAKTNKTIYEYWEDEFKRMADEGFFDHIGTFVIDSATTWALSIMDQVRKTGGKAMVKGSWIMNKNMTPDQKDWQIQMECIKMALDDFLSLPCNCYLICHEVTESNEDTGRVMTYPLLTGRLKEQIPPMFDEVYHTTVQTKSSGNHIVLLTQNDGSFIAKSRLSGTPPKLNRYEEFNIKELMRKVGLGKEAEDKPPLDQIGGSE